MKTSSYILVVEHRKHTVFDIKCVSIESWIFKIWTTNTNFVKLSWMNLNILVLACVFMMSLWALICLNAILSFWIYQHHRASFNRCNWTVLLVIFSPTTFLIISHSAKVICFVHVFHFTSSLLYSKRWYESYAVRNFFTRAKVLLWKVDA